LKKKADPAGGGHTGGSTKNSNILANSNLYSKRLWGMNQGVRRRALMKKPEAKFLVSVSL
jgi:hypothetical protein